MFTVRNPAGEQESNSVPFVVGALAADEEPEPELEDTGKGGNGRRKRSSSTSRASD